MAQLRLALAQINPTVGDLTGNTELIVRAVREAHDAGAQLVAVGEMALTGYPVEDLVLRESFIADSRSAMAQLRQRLTAENLDDIAVVVGTVDADGPVRPQATGPRGTAGARNTAVLLHRGEVIANHHKHHLPTHGVFDEDRQFVPGTEISVIAADAPAAIGQQTDGRPINLSMLVCADIWYDRGPLDRCATAGIDVLICINASPYEQDKDSQRIAACQHAAARTGAIVAYVNLVGGQDELVFDGSSMVVHPDGSVLAHAPLFTPHLTVVDLEIPEQSVTPTPAATAPSVATELGDIELGDTEPAPLYQLVEPPSMGVQRATTTLRPVPARSTAAGAGSAGLIAAELSNQQQNWGALKLGLADYVHKNGFSSVVLGVSGGIDSAVCAALACDALGAANVYGVALPSPYSSQHSYDDATELATRTGIQLRVLPITTMMKAFSEELPLDGLAAQNLQARIRAVLLMGISNSEGQLLLSTGNKSERAVGYSTLYGDAAGAFAPLADVYKTMVWELATWRNADARQRGEQPPIPESSITKPPSAELGLDQLDSDALPPYEQLDAILRLYVDFDAGRDEIVVAGHDRAVIDAIATLVNAAEHKRRQAPPGPKITEKAFGRDRQLPITNRFAG